MFDAAARTRHQRAAGKAEVTLSLRRGAVRLDRLWQSGCAKAILPQVHSPVPEVVFLNTAGGLTGGDDLRLALRLGDGAEAVATTQAAERVYDAGAGAAARVSVRCEVGRGARLDWLPQETILFDRAALDRRTVIELDHEARCLAVETLVFGRAAMGERIGTLDLRDRREFWRGGAPVLMEPLQLDASVLGPRPAVLRDATAVASLAFVGRGAEDAVSAVRKVSVGGVEAAASGWDGRLTLRAFAADFAPLRRYLAAVLTTLRRRPLPQVWQR